MNTTLENDLLFDDAALLEAVLGEDDDKDPQCSLCHQFIPKYCEL